MKLVLFACLLIVAGVSAFPQDLDPQDVDPQDVDVAVATPNQGRFVDTWIQNRLRLLVAFIQLRGYDPLHRHLLEYDETILDGSVYLKGFFQKLEVVGLSGIYINSISYNIVMGRLDLDIVLAQVRMAVGKFKSEVRYGDIGGSVELSGSVVVSGVRLVGNSLLSVYPGQAPTILNIDVRFTVDSIEADLDVKVKRLDDEEPTDVTEPVNNFFNIRVLELIYIHQESISTILGVVIREAVNWGWPY